MIDFELMVKNVLWEMSTDSMFTLVESTSADPATGIAQFLTEPTGGRGDIPFKELQGFWSTEFRDYSFFSNEQELKSLVPNIDALRSTGSGQSTYEKIDNIESIFPVIDLIVQLYVNNFKSSQPKDKAPDTYTDFFNELKQQKRDNVNLRPLDYRPLSPWARNLKAAYLKGSSDVLGKLRLQDQNENNSFYQIVYNFLALRKQAISIKLPLRLKNLSGASMINAIMLQPWSLVSGTFAISDQQLRQVYDQLTVDQIVDVSLAAYELYKNELSTVLALDETKIKPYLTNSELYKKFIGEYNKPASSFMWNETATTSSTPPPLKPFEVAPNNFSYSLKNLRVAATQFKVPQAAFLIKEFEKLGNYIKTKEGRDIMGGVTQIAQGIAGLGKKMGS